MKAKNFNKKIVKSKKQFEFHLKDTFFIFLNSFKKLDKFLYVFIYDILFYVFLYAGFVVWLYASSNLRLYTSQSQDFMMWATETAAQGQSFIIHLIIYTILLFIYLILIWSFFKSISWSIVVKKDWNMGLFLKFLKTNIIWFPAWLIISLLFTAMFKTNIETQIWIFMGCMAVVWYFTLILCYELTHEPHLKTMFAAMGFAVKKLHYLIITLAFGGLIFVLLCLIILPMSYLPEPYGIFFSIIIFTLFSAWFKYFIAHSLTDIKDG